MKAFGLSDSIKAVAFASAIATSGCGTEVTKSHYPDIIPQVGESCSIVSEQGDIGEDGNIKLDVVLSRISQNCAKVLEYTNEGLCPIKEGKFFNALDDCYFIHINQKTGEYQGELFTAILQFRDFFIKFHKLPEDMKAELSKTKWIGLFNSHEKSITNVMPLSTYVSIYDHIIQLTPEEQKKLQESKEWKLFIGRFEKFFPGIEVPIDYDPYSEVMTYLMGSSQEADEFNPYGSEKYDAKIALEQMMQNYPLESHSKVYLASEQ